MIFMAGLMMAVNCALGPCVHVYTDPTTHQLIISANQNRPGSTFVPHPTPTHRARPTTVVKPKPQTWVPYKAVPIVHRAYRAPVKKLPVSKILYQPANDAITGVPVYLWSDTNAVFQVATMILGIAVSVEMNPSFLWDFGDGAKFTTNETGGPYPDATITHTYKRAGTYTINLTISWAGSWAAQGAVLPVSGGAIVQNASATIQVSPGPTDFTR